MELNTQYLEKTADQIDRLIERYFGTSLDGLAGQAPTCSLQAGNGFGRLWSSSPRKRRKREVSD